MKKRLLFPISEKDYFTVMGRISYLLKDLSADFGVDLLTNSTEVYDDINKKLESHDDMRIKLAEAKYLPTSYDFRNDLCRIFVKYTYDLFVPGTDLKMWKTTAFDDFWGHITGCSYPDITKIEADMVLMPLISHDDSPTEETDVFYTSIISMAKEAGIRVVGYQVYPVFNTNKLMPRMMDAVIVRQGFERDFYAKIGIEPGKVLVLTDYKDIYSISTIEDTYKNHIYNSQLEIRRDELAIVVHNHPKFRPQLRDLFRVIKKTGIPVALSFVKRDFTIRDLSEGRIIEGVFFEEIKNIGCRFYLIESGSTVPVIMTSDVVVSPVYLATLEFAAQYGKKALVYNPLYSSMPDVNGITFINDSGRLADSLKAAYAAKRETVGMKEAVNLIMGKKQ